MGRKIKPLGLRRRPISISLPLDVIGHLDRIVLASNMGISRSRIVERLIRESMLKGQTTFKSIIATWKCSACGFTWETKDTNLDFVFCIKCNRKQEPSLDFKGQRIIGIEEEE